MPLTNRRNQLAFGLGTIGRDMAYSIISMFLIFYLTDIIKLADRTLWWVTFIILAARIFDALNDPIMGIIVDNTRSRWGKFKPWIAFGALFSGLFTLLLFSDFGLRETPFLISFTLFYVLWGITYTANDISYWSMLPSLSIDPRQREKMGAFARICANVGLFTVVVGITPVTHRLGESTGSMPLAYFLFALGVVLILWIGQSITLFGVKEPKGIFKEQPTTPLKELFRTIVGNDQLLTVVISLALFMTAYLTTTTFGIYFFKYAYGDEAMYSLFAAVLGVSQLTALILFPLFSKRFPRRKLFSGAMLFIICGYLLFYLSPMNMIPIGIAGMLIFLGQAFIQLLMILFLADTIEYGQWKLGRRNESITFSLQPLIYKIGGALGSGIVGAVIILSGISRAETAAEVSTGGLWMMKTAMLLLPMLLMGASFLVFHFRYKIDKEMYQKIIEDLKEKGEIGNSED